MLVLQRDPGEAIIIETPDGDIIRVVIVPHRKHIRVGIDADKKYKIVREELTDVEKKAD